MVHHKSVPVLALLAVSDPREYIEDGIEKRTMMDFERIACTPYV